MSSTNVVRYIGLILFIARLHHLILLMNLNGSTYWMAFFCPVCYRNFPTLFGDSGSFFDKLFMLLINSVLRTSSVIADLVPSSSALATSSLCLKPCTT